MDDIEQELGAELQQQNQLQAITAPESTRPTLQNVVSTVNLGCRLDLRKIAMEARNAEFNPKRFAAVIMRIREPKTTALIFGSGKLVVTGAKGEEQARQATKKYTKIISKLKFPVKQQASELEPPLLTQVLPLRQDRQEEEFAIQNMVGRADVGFPIRLEGINVQHNLFCSYEPELFPGLVYHMKEPKVVLLIFVTGKVVITGAKKREDIDRAFNSIYPVLHNFKKGDANSIIPTTKRKKSSSGAGTQAATDVKRRKANRKSGGASSQQPQQVASTGDYDEGPS